jgi:DNA-directed RNA polymerase specialized sigma24 family protein
MSTLVGDGHSTVTLGGWLDVVDSRGWGDASVWLQIHDCAQAALAAVRRRLRPGDGEDLVADVVLLARTPPASWRRSDRRDIPLVRWLGGVVRNRLRALRRAELPTTGRALDAVASAEACRDPVPSGVDAASVLTAKQLASWDLHCQGVGTRAAAEALGVTRDAHRRRLERAKRRLASEGRAERLGVGEWAPTLVRELLSKGDTVNAALLLLRHGGQCYRACAEALRLTVDAVRSRLARLWRMWKASLPVAPRDTPVPGPALHA